MKNGAESLLSIINHLLNTMLPFIDGLVLAYILNPIMVTIEGRIVLPLFKKNEKLMDKHSLARGLSLFFTMVIFLLIITGLIVMIFPQLFSSIQSIIARTPYYLSSLNTMVIDLLKNNQELEEIFRTYSGRLQDFINELLPELQSIISSLSSTVLSYLSAALTNIFKFVIGIILCIYLLFKKETYLAQCKKIIYAFLSTDRANDIINNARFTNRTFGGFITGKLFDSLIIGILCFVCMTLLKMPYTLLISCFIGVTNVIPFFGPFLGAIPSTLILFIINPMKALIFVIFVIILQQFDGNILGPKILGDSTGLPGFWVIFSITFFGSFLGVWGMFIGVPIFSVIYAAFKAYLENRLKKKNMPPETSFYIVSDFYSESELEKDSKPEMSGEYFRLKNGAVSSKFQNSRSRSKPNNNPSKTDTAKDPDPSEIYMEIIEDLKDGDEKVSGPDNDKSVKNKASTHPDKKKD